MLTYVSPNHSCGNSSCRLLSIYSSCIIVCCFSQICATDVHTCHWSAFIWRMSVFSAREARNHAVVRSRRISFECPALLVVSLSHDHQSHPKLMSVGTFMYLENCAISPWALKLDPNKIVPSWFVQDMSKISIETKYQKSPSFPLVLNFLRLYFKMDDFLAENYYFISFQIKLHSIICLSHDLFCIQI